jgi:glycosyltransferase involved in cell wall biosynthesis
MAICNSVGSVIASTGKMWQALALNTVWLALFTASFMLLVPRLASQGLALSYCGSYALFAVMSCFYGHSVCGMPLEKAPSLVALSVLGFAAAAFTMERCPHFLALIGLLVTTLLAAAGWRMVATERERDHARLELRSLLRRETASRPVASRPRILYVCHVDWGWIKQRPQHLAEHLRQYFDVTVAFPCSLRRAAMVNHFRFSRSCIPLLRAPMRDRFSFLAMLDTLALGISLRLLIWLVRPAYIWLTWPDLYRYLPRSVGSSIIYDCMDDAQAFPREQKRAAILARVELELVAHAQLVFVSSEHLRAVLHSRHGAQKTFHLLRNAFDGKPLPAPRRNRAFRRVYQIGYCGTIATWLDWDLLVKIVNALPGMEIHLVGAIDRGVSILHHDRILWRGPKRHDELPAVMGEFDCLAMPFQVTPLIESVDPVKLYEYIGFNKPIVAVYYDEIARFAPFAHFYRTHAEAVDLISRLMTGALEKKYSDAERRAFLAANSWRERASLAAAAMQGDGRK